MQPTKLLPHDVATLPLAPAYVQAARLSLARSHMALFPARLALARWTSGASQPHLNGGSMPALRTAWFTRAQQEFQTWLEAGGFVQHDDADALCPACMAEPRGTAA